MEEAEKEGAIKEMKEEISFQKFQIASQEDKLASQQEELMRQMEQVARQNDELEMLRESVQKIALSVGYFPQSIPNENLSSHTVELEDDSLKRDAARDGSVNEVECLNQLLKDETALEMKEEVTERSRLEYPVVSE